jgi:hypothetical protein
VLGWGFFMDYIKVLLELIILPQKSSSLPAHSNLLLSRIPMKMKNSQEDKKEKKGHIPCTPTKDLFVA